MAGNRYTAGILGARTWVHFKMSEIFKILCCRFLNYWRRKLSIRRKVSYTFKEISIGNRASYLYTNRNDKTLNTTPLADILHSLVIRFWYFKVAVSIDFAVNYLRDTFE